MDRLQVKIMFACQWCDLKALLVICHFFFKTTNSLLKKRSFKVCSRKSNNNQFEDWSKTPASSLNSLSRCVTVCLCAALCRWKRPGSPRWQLTSWLGCRYCCCPSPCSGSLSPSSTASFSTSHSPPSTATRCGTAWHCCWKSRCVCVCVNYSFAYSSSTPDCFWFHD